MRTLATEVTSAVPAWTDSQRGIIEAPADARMLVEAGPGTGKTAVACGRVAWLAAQGVNPSAIIMLSFTRTAVSEIRNRIWSWSDTPGVAAARITTADSMAWFFRYGAGEDFGRLTGSYDDNVEECIRLLRKGSPVLDEYLEATAHLIIDESQDLTGVRSRLVSELIRKAPRSCGVTVFGDPVQSIYGFTTEVDDKGSDGGTLLGSFPFGKSGFKCLQLDTIHRTESPTILRLFVAVRDAANGDGSAGKPPLNVLTVIRDHADDLGRSINDSNLGEADLVLCRRRAQALHLAEYYPGVCRLRLSNLPAAVHPWVGAVFHGYTGNSISLVTFEELWESDVDDIVCGSVSREQAWELLQRHVKGRRGQVDLGRLRTILGRKRPHVDFCLPDYGIWGPIFGTIHASKGREADRVVLALPRNDKRAVVPDTDPLAAVKNAEESRVYYVGATRARRQFDRCEAPSLIGATALESGRAWQLYKKKPQPKVQFGIDGDLDPTALVRRDLSDSAATAISAHERLAHACREYVVGDESPVPVRARLRKAGREWRHALEVDNEKDSSGSPLGWFTTRVSTDLWGLGKNLRARLGTGPLKPPGMIRHLWIVGLCTAVVDPECGDADLLHEPFATSGFLLAPIVFGFPTIYFQKHFRSKR